MDFVNLLVAAVAMAAALLTRPWRSLADSGPPWPWIAWWLAIPALWGADRYVQTPVAQPLSGACLLLLMCGWPLAVIALVPAALVTAWLAGLDAPQALHRYVWLGVLPATFALAMGAAVRRWLPRHLMVYILGRGFFVTALATSIAGALSAALHPRPEGLDTGDLALARWLAAWGDAWLTGLLVAIFVAFRPQWLATYTDRLYLPADAPPR